MTKETDNELVRTLTERNKIADFAMQKLGMDEIRAEAFVKVAGHHFIWDGTLRFKGLHGEVPADDETCTGFCERELLGPVFGMTKKADAEHGAPSADLIAQAKAVDARGKPLNLGARGQLWRELHGNKPRSKEAETTAELEKLLAGKAADDDKPADKIETKGFNGANPWRAQSWNVTKQGELVKKLGADAAAGIARAANSHLGATRPTKAA